MLQSILLISPFPRKYLILPIIKNPNHEVTYTYQYQDPNDKLAYFDDSSIYSQTTENNTTTIISGGTFLFIFSLLGILIYFMKNKKDIKLNNTKYESAVPMRVCTKCIPSNAIIVAANKAYISFLKSSFAIRYIINIIEHFFDSQDTNYKYIMFQSYWDTTTIGEICLFDKEGNKIPITPMEEQGKSFPAIFPPNLYANGVTPKKYIGIDIISFPNGGCVYS